MCDGESDSCPDDVVRHVAKAFKCGRQCYFCGVEEVRVPAALLRPQPASHACTAALPAGQRAAAS